MGVVRSEEGWKGDRKVGRVKREERCSGEWTRMKRLNKEKRLRGLGRRTSEDRVEEGSGGKRIGEDRGKTEERGKEKKSMNKRGRRR